MNFFVRVRRPANQTWDGTFVNAAEKQFAALADSVGVIWTYESTAYGVLYPHKQIVFCPDFYLRSYGVHVEIHGAVKWDPQQRQLTPKRKKIRWLSEESGIPTVLLHLHNWPDPRDDWGHIEKLIERAREEAALAHQQVAHPIDP